MHAQMLLAHQDILQANNIYQDMENKYLSPEIQEIILAVEECCIAASVAEYKNPFEQEVQW